ncbi:toll/interleukin-1 receptor domain-containing protein [Kitasatospora sp. NBC_01266]|uniref:toll/interleukin-1 receptor domain-containing protein n=1 Tax=Kitasatospora sp. NBC_01266 TaxID=2903572 RepID=UPI002E33C365|nr:toll/interleukin-1 receptor domain-containing protein [Kitasatospora sp. NBC_01266]
MLLMISMRLFWKEEAPDSVEWHRYTRFMSDPWSPDRVMSLTEALAALTQAESEKFFLAHGLDDAYRRPGAWSSKSQKVTSAIREAMARGDDFYIALFGKAEEFVAKSAASQAPLRSEATKGGVKNMASGRSIFISHATQDKPLADELGRFLVLGGVPRESIFYSSERSTGIPSGESISSYLRSALVRSTLVIELISKSFLERPFCLMEMGAAWVLEKDTYPIVVPPLSRERVGQALGDIRVATMVDDFEVVSLVDELHEKVQKQLSGISLRLQDWNAAGRSFKEYWARHLNPSR